MFAANSLPRRNAVSFPFSATVADHRREFFFTRGGGYRSLLSWAGRFGSVEGGNVIWVSKMRRGQSTPLPSPRRAIVQGFRFMSLRTCATRWRGGDSAGIYIYIYKSWRRGREFEGRSAAPVSNNDHEEGTVTTPGGFTGTPRQRARL